jgi:hypothetical protein
MSQHKIRYHSAENVQTFVVLIYFIPYDRLCGLLVRVPGYRSRGPGSILGATTFSEK